MCRNLEGEGEIYFTLHLIFTAYKTTHNTNQFTCDAINRSHLLKLVLHCISINHHMKFTTGSTPLPFGNHYCWPIVASLFTVVQCWLHLHFLCLAFTYNETSTKSKK